MSALGRLSITLGLDAAQFTDGITKAEYQANKFAAIVGGKMASGAKLAATGFAAATAAAVGFFTAIDQLSKSAADYQDFAESVGTTAEAFASLRIAVDVGGSSLESAAGALNKLTKGLSGADEETKGAAQAVQALGFNLKEFQQLDPVEQFEALAKALDKYADDQNKVAIAMALFGKSGAEQLKVMKALIDTGGLQVRLTQEQIQLADEYADKQQEVRTEIQLLAQSMATASLPALIAVQEAFRDTVLSIIGVDKSFKDLSKSTVVRDFAEDTVNAFSYVADAIEGVTRVVIIAGKALGAMAAQREAISRRDVAGVQEISRAFREDFDRIFGAQTLGQRIRENIGNIRVQRETFTGPPEALAGGGKPRLKFNPDAQSGAAKEAKKILDKQLSDLDNFIKAEDRLLSQREAALQRLYDNDKISIQQYFDDRVAAINQNLRATEEAYDKQIKLLQDFAAKQKGEERLATEAKIGDVRGSRADAVAKAQEQIQKAQDEAKRSAQDYADKVAEVRARVLELQGTEEAAAQAALIRFDIQNRALASRAEAEGDSATITNIKALRDREELQTRINAILKDADQIQQSLTNTEQRLHLEREVGLRGELQTLNELGNARSASAAQLQEIARKYLEIARASQDPTIIQQAEAFKLKMDELAASADVLAEKFRNTFADSFANAFDQFVQGTLSAREAMRQFVTDVLSQINRMLANEAAMAIFGKGGVAGGLASSFAGLFGGGQNLGGVFADGGYPPVGKVSVVGERGPELFVPSTAGRIIPNHMLGGSTVEQNITFVLPSQVTKSTQNQIASRTLLAAQRAMSRGVAS